MVSSWRNPGFHQMEEWVKAHNFVSVQPKPEQLKLILKGSGRGWEEVQGASGWLLEADGGSARERRRPELISRPTIKWKRRQRCPRLITAALSAPCVQTDGFFFITVEHTSHTHTHTKTHTDTHPPTLSSSVPIQSHRDTNTCCTSKSIIVYLAPFAERCLRE